MNGLEIVQQEIARRLGPQIETWISDLAPGLIKAQSDGKPLETVPDPPAVAPATAAKRTVLQGSIALILATVFGYVADEIGGDDFQVFDLGDWKGLGSGAVVAVIMALLAFGQRKIGR